MKQLLKRGLKRIVLYLQLQPRLKGHLMHCRGHSIVCLQEVGMTHGLC